MWDGQPFIDLLTIILGCKKAFVHMGIKGLMARLIHWHSHRYEQPFIAVHCEAIPDTLFNLN
jgi:hypothetical protein